MLIEDEHARVLDAIAGDPRTASALCRRNLIAVGNLPKRLFRSYDLWSAAVQLNRAEAGLWLRGVVAQAVADPVAAITALTLQPGAGNPAARRWVAVLVKSKPLFAYEAARWSRWTWILPRWENLRDNCKPGHLGLGLFVVSLVSRCAAGAIPRGAAKRRRRNPLGSRDHPCHQGFWPRPAPPLRPAAQLQPR